MVLVECEVDMTQNTGYKERSLETRPDLVNVLDESLREDTGKRASSADTRNSMKTWV